MIIAIIVAILTLIMFLLLSGVSEERLEKKNQEIAKLERQNNNSARDIGFTNWHIERIRRSEERAVEEYQKLAARKIYCFVSNRSNVITISIGYFVGYRCEVLPLGFIIDLKGGIVRDKTTDEEISIYE